VILVDVKDERLDFDVREDTTPKGAPVGANN
jgi:hypothetical protein